VELAKKECIRGEYRILAYDALTNSYYKKEKVLLAPLRVTYIFAGPREAILHAIIERNYGCTHFIVGRDHAGVVDYYEKYACHRIFEDYPDLGIEVLPFKEVFFCTLCATTATSDTCPHDERYRIAISGTGIRECLRRGYLPPKEIVRPEVSRIAIQGVQPKGMDEKGESIYPPGATLRRLFPFYLVAQRLGGFLREKRLDESTLTNRDLEAALLDIRTNAHEIYNGVFWEAAAMADIDRNLLPRWAFEYRGKAADMQTWLANALKDKVKSAEEVVGDKFMYQDKREAERELKSSVEILSNIPKKVPPKGYKRRIWNPLPYEEYREGD
jgi:sulfate adenylyltransferase